MPETYYVGSYWLARREPAEACARRAERFFRLLGRCDPEWTHWHDSAGDEALDAPLPHLEEVTFTRMFAGKDHRDGPDGFKFLFWVGDTVDTATSVAVRCGASTPWLCSACVLSLPEHGPTAERVLTAATLTEALRAMALAWEPEWAIATSHEHRDLVTEGADVGTFVGWVMYFSSQRGTVPPLPAPVRVEPVEDMGTLVILTPERFTASNPEHVALAARVHELLDGAGLLRPLQPYTPRDSTP